MKDRDTFVMQVEGKDLAEVNEAALQSGVLVKEFDLADPDQANAAASSLYSQAREDSFIGVDGKLHNNEASIDDYKRVVSDARQAARAVVRLTSTGENPDMSTFWNNLSTVKNNREK